MHVSIDQWTLYAENELDEAMREEYEDHMYECDSCIALYMKAVEGLGLSIPAEYSSFSRLSSLKRRHDVGERNFRHNVLIRFFSIKEV